MMRRRLGLLIAVLTAASCATPAPPPRSPAPIAAPAPAPPPEAPQVCYARGPGATPAAGDVSETDDPNQSVFVLDRQLLPELGRRLDRPSGAQKHSSLDRAIIQMVVRRHADEVKTCAAPLLAKAPGKAGTVAARFAVGADGGVTRAQVTESTVADAETEDCIGRSVCGWRFPALATGHTLLIDYRFLLAP